MRHKLEQGAYLRCLPFLKKSFSQTILFQSFFPSLFFFERRRKPQPIHPEDALSGLSVFPTSTFEESESFLLHRRRQMSSPTGGSSSRNSTGRTSYHYSVSSSRASVAMPNSAFFSHDLERIPSTFYINLFRETYLETLRDNMHPSQNKREVITRLIRGTQEIKFNSRAFGFSEMERVCKEYVAASQECFRDHQFARHGHQDKEQYVRSEKYHVNITPRTNFLDLQRELQKEVAPLVDNVLNAIVLEPRTAGTNTGFKAVRKFVGWEAESKFGNRRTHDALRQTAASDEVDKTHEDSALQALRVPWLSYSCPVEGVFVHCWKSATQGRAFLHRFNLMSLIVQSYELVSLRVPFSVGFLCRGIFCTVTVHAPIVHDDLDPRYDPTHSKGSVVAHELAILRHVLSVRYSPEVSLEVYRGADGFVYITNLQDFFLLKIDSEMDEVSKAMLVDDNGSPASIQDLLLEAPSKIPWKCDSSDYLRWEAQEFVVKSNTARMILCPVEDLLGEHWPKAVSVEEKVLLDERMPLVVSELRSFLTLEHADSLKRALTTNLCSKVFHKHGLNLRFLYNVHQTIYFTKSILTPEQDDILLRILQLEMAFRTLKDMLRLELLYSTREHDFQQVKRVNRLLYELFVAESESKIWEEQFLVLLRRKFSCKPDFFIMLDAMAAKLITQLVASRLGMVFERSLGYFSGFRCVLLDSSEFLAAESERFNTDEIQEFWDRALEAEERTRMSLGPDRHISETDGIVTLLQNYNDPPRIAALAECYRVVALTRRHQTAMTASERCHELLYRWCPVEGEPTVIRKKFEWEVRNLHLISPLVRLSYVQSQVLPAEELDIEDEDLPGPPPFLLLATIVGRHKVLLAKLPRYKDKEDAAFIGASCLRYVNQRFEGEFKASEKPKLIDGFVFGLHLVRHATWTDVGIMDVHFSGGFKATRLLDIRKDSYAYRTILTPMHRFSARLDRVNRDKILIALLRAITEQLFLSKDPLVCKQWKAWANINLCRNVARFGLKSMDTRISHSYAVCIYAFAQAEKLSDVELQELASLVRYVKELEYLQDEELQELTGSPKFTNCLGAVTIALHTSGEVVFAQRALTTQRAAWNNADAAMMNRSIDELSHSALGLVASVLKQVLGKQLGYKHRRLRVMDYAYRVGLYIWDRIIRDRIERLFLEELHGVWVTLLQQDEMIEREFIYDLFWAWRYTARKIGHDHQLNDMNRAGTHQTVLMQGLREDKRKEEVVRYHNLNLEDELDIAMNRPKQVRTATDTDDDSKEAKDDDTEGVPQGGLQTMEDFDFEHQKWQSRREEEARRKAVLDQLRARFYIARVQRYEMEILMDDEQDAWDFLMTSHELQIAEMIQRKKLQQEIFMEMKNFRVLTKRSLQMRWVVTDTQSKTGEQGSTRTPRKGGNNMNGSVLSHSLSFAESSAYFDPAFILEKEQDDIIIRLHQRLLVALAETERRRYIIDWRNWELSCLYEMSELQIEEIRTRVKYEDLQAKFWEEIMTSAAKERLRIEAKEKRETEIEEEDAARKKLVIDTEADRLRWLRQNEEADELERQAAEIVQRIAAENHLILQTQIRTEERNQVIRAELLRQKREGYAAVKLARTLIDICVASEKVHELEQKTVSHDRVQLAEEAGRTKFYEELEKRKLDARTSAGAVEEMLAQAKAVEDAELKRRQFHITELFEEQQQKRASAAKKRDEAERLAMEMLANRQPIVRHALYVAPLVPLHPYDAEEFRAQQEARNQEKQMKIEELAALGKRRKDLAMACLYLAHHATEEANHALHTSYEARADAAREAMKKVVEERCAPARKQREEKLKVLRKVEEEKHKVASMRKKELAKIRRDEAVAKEERSELRTWLSYKKTQDVHCEDRLELAKRKLVAAQQEADQWDRKMSEKLDFYTNENRRLLSNTVLNASKRKVEIHKQQELEEFFGARAGEDLQHTDGLHEIRKQLPQLRSASVGLVSHGRSNVLPPISTMTPMPSPRDRSSSIPLQSLGASVARKRYSVDRKS